MRNKSTPLIYKIFKPRGASSFSVLFALKRKFPKGKELKMGHFGTLDPFADGLLLVGVYGATRLNQYVQKEFPKTYEAVGILGQKTNTGDIEGSIEKIASPDHLKNCSLEDIKRILGDKFIGEYHQSPPIFSAAKHNGKNLYEYALKGEAIEKAPVKRTIYNLEIKNFEFPYLTFSATVSSGTYIRSLFEDMAKVLGSIGHLKELRRTSIGNLQVNDSEGPELFNRDKGMTLDQVYPLPSIYLDSSDLKKFCCGNSVRPSNPLLKSGKSFWVYDEFKFLIGMAEVREEKVIPVWVFPQNAVS